MTFRERFLLLFLICKIAVAQNIPLAPFKGGISQQYADSLNQLGHQMLRGENDSLRRTASNIFENLMEKIITDSTSFELPFDSIKNISVKTAPDNSFRLYTWQYPSYIGDHYYYFGFLQCKNLKSNKIILYRLQDSSEVILKADRKKLKPENWYGSIYYTIIANKKGGKKYYTLLGWHGRNEQFTQKVIDVLSFDSGRPVFGLPVFKNNSIYIYRVIFEFTAQATMVLRHEAKDKLIAFDHLSAGNRRYSAGSAVGPDGSYDAYKLTSKGYWELVENVDVTNGFAPKPKEVKVYKDEELKK